MPLPLLPCRYQGCEYRCKICQSVRFSADQLAAHAKSKHRISRKDYENKYGDLKTKSAIFKCKICSAEIQHNIKSIIFHLRQRHQMSNADYMKKFNLKSYKKRISTRECLNASSKASKPAKPLPGRSIKPKHQRSQKDYETNFRLFKNKSSTFECKICNKKMRHNIESIASHLQKRHQMSNDTYLKKFVIKPCKIRLTPFEKQSESTKANIPSQHSPKRRRSDSSTEKEVYQSEDDTLST